MTSYMGRLVGHVVEQLTIAITHCFGLGSSPAFGELSFLPLWSRRLLCHG